MEVSRRSTDDQGSRRHLHRRRVGDPISRGLPPSQLSVVVVHFAPGLAAPGTRTTAARPSM